MRLRGINWIEATRKGATENPEMHFSVTFPAAMDQECTIGSFGAFPSVQFDPEGARLRADATLPFLYLSCGGVLAFVACSRSYAYASSSASVHMSPMKASTKGVPSG